jgi:type I restriction enzyme S subunit
MRQLDKAVIDSCVSRIVQRGIESGWQIRRLGEVAAINPRRDRLESEQDVSFVPMAALNELTGCIESPQTRHAGSVGAGYKQFRRGDIIFARITPCMQNGKTAIFEGETTHGYGSTEFHVLRPSSEVRAEWLHRLLRTQEFRSRAARCMTGTAGQQRVQADFMRTVGIPVPSLRDQDKTIAAIDRLLHIASELRLRRRKAFDLVSAIEPSIMNQAFSGLI